ncbi:MAG: D-alanyl-D-alanine carboxypeptidase/D-alanyl-D-alanine-endopeptidase [Gammaproteobacteria bacterium]|nr:D-alanyl-D-alanine carboxypeptidase/D-alanyl-D-alanine-endopeptidase [Gammaproteobacteria bacterium]
MIIQQGKRGTTVKLLLQVALIFAKRGMVWIIGLLFCQLAVAGNMAALSQQINALIARDSTQGLVGIAVADGKSGNIIYRYRGSSRFVPASNMKVFTAAAALYQLGSDYRFHTKIAVGQQQFKQGVVNGNLYIIFSGDPTLKVKMLQQMIKTLHKQGVRQITGNVMIDGSRFRSPNYAPGWTWNSINWYYSAPITAVALNQNFIVVKMLATRRIGAPTAVKVTGYSSYFPVSANVVAASQQTANHSCSLLLRASRTNHLYFNGCWPARKDDSVLKIAIKNPQRFAQGVVAAALKSNHIQLQGQVVGGKAPTGLQTLVNHSSPPLSAMTKTMLKHSNNFYAGVLIKTLGAVYYQRGDFQNGVRAEKAILKQHAAINLKGTPIFDGSGQSYYNRIQPQQFVNLLYHISRAKIYSTFYRALPISGIDGTLAYRMGGKSRLLRKVHAKTGTLSAGHVTLAGYVTAADGRRLIISIMVNNAINLRHARTFQDRVIALLYKYY